MSILERVVVIFYICVALFTLLYLSDKLKGQGRTLNCGLSEISPDFTPAQRQQCRQLRGHKL